MKPIVTTTFVAKTSIQIPVLRGGGWSASIHMETKAQSGETIICETHQTPSTKKEDTSVRLQFPGEKITVEFETLGRLIASGAIEQVISKA